MVLSNRSRLRSWIALAAAPLLVSCAVPGVLRVTPTAPAVAGPNRSAAALLLPAPTPPRRYTETTGGASLVGLVRFRTLDHPFFADNGAAYRTLALPTATERAMVTASTLEEEIYVRSGQAVDAVSDAGGVFRLDGSAPVGTPYVVNANLARGHRLSAIVPEGAALTELDEATSMIAETARWQLRPHPLAVGHDPAEKTLRDLGAATLADMTDDARSLLDAAAFTPEGDVPDVAALKSGAGHVLRNLHVLAFGAQVAAAGDTAANRLSDAWKALLGFRPLAITVVGGNGIRGYNQGDGRLAADTELLTPADAQADAAGNVLIVEADDSKIRYVPATDQGAWLGATSPMTKDRMYTLAGIVSGPTTTAAVNAAYAPWEFDSVDNPELAPLVGHPDPAQRPALFSLQRLLVLEQGGKRHLLVTSHLGHRVQFIPDGNPGVNPADPTDAAGPAEVVTMFGRDFYAGRLYTVLGNGVAVVPEIYTVPEGEVPLTATDDARLNRPTGMASDSVGNLYVMDSNHGYVRVLRQSDGMTFPLKMTYEGSPYTAAGAHDLRLREAPGANYLYWTDTLNHVVCRAKLPDDLSALEANPAAGLVVPPIAIEIVLGKPGQAGFIDVAMAEVYYPAIYDVSDGVPEAQALLSSPMSLDFDAAGNLLVADAARVRMLTAAGLDGTGEVFTIAGGLNTRYLAGDSRLAYMPGTSYLNREPSGNFLLADRRENVVRRLWTLRGTR